MNLKHENKSYKLRDNKKNVVHNIENLSWGSWNYNSPIVLEKNSADVPPIKSKCFALENKREFYMCIEGHLQSFEETYQIISKMNEDFTVNGNIKSLCISVMYLMVWLQNCDSSFLIPYIVNQKDGLFRSHLEFIRSFLQKAFTHSIEADNNELRNLVFSTILSGWELVCFDLETQVFWFNAFKQHSTDRKLIQKLEPLLEDNVVNITCPLQNIIQKLIQSGKNYSFLNINKINTSRVFYFLEKEGTLVCKPLNMSINPKSLCFPFYWLLLGLKLKISSDITLEKKPKAAEKYPFGDVNEIEENPFLKDKIEGKFPQAAKPKKTTTEEELDYTAIPKKCLHSFIISDKSENNNDTYMKTVSDQFWQETTEFILNNLDTQHSQCLLELLSNMFTYCIGDLNEFLEHNFLQGNNKESNLKYYYDIIYNFVDKNFKFSQELIRQSFKEKSSSAFKRQVLIYTTYITNSIFCKIKFYPIKILQEFEDKFLELIKEISTILEEDNFKVLEILKTFSSCGYQIENEKDYEYSFSPSEITQINETVRFSGSSAVVVELDLKTSGEKFQNNDLIIVSEEHPYHHTKINSNNNYCSYGSCFLLKINNSNQKKLFLPGEELKLISPPDIDHRTGGRSKYYSMPSSQKTVGKNILKVRSYPFRNMVFAYSNRYVLYCLILG